MKKIQRVITAAVCLVCLTVFTAFPQAAFAAGTADTEIVIFHTNDTHGYLTGDGENVVGLDKVAALKKAEPDSVLVDAGDATQGLPVASLTKGSDVIRLMNLAGYDLMAAGNHEFDFGTEQFLANAAAADFPILAANVYREDRLLLSGVKEESSGDHVILERKGVRIGFFGLTTAETAVAVNPLYISGLTFRDEAETAKEQIDALKDEGADVIIAVCHMGEGGSSCDSTQLAEAMTGSYKDELDVIIDGHSHTVENREVNGVTIVQTGTGLSAVGRLELEISGDKVTASEKLLTPSDLTDLAGDEAVAQELSEIEASQTGMLNQVAGKTDATLWAGTVGGISVARAVETNFGDFAADAYREAGIAFLKNQGKEDFPVIAVENGGGIRASLCNGDITLGDLISAFPYSNTLYMKEITPATLCQIMEISAGSMDGQDGGTGMLLQKDVFGGFLQVSGFTVEYNPDASEGQRVVSISAEGSEQPLSRSDTSSKLLLVSNNYIMSGGNGYDVLAQLPKKGEAGGELETIQGYLEKCMEEDTLDRYAAPAGRIVIKGADYEPHDYTACVRITDGSGAAAAGQKVSYRVDGGAYREGITDGEGILRVTVSDGAHGIRLDDGQKDVYVDNYTGIGLVEDGIRSFPTLKITEEGGQTEEKLPFSDVEEDAWYYDAVSFADEKGLMQGSGGMFYPEQNTSRAMIVTVLWRLAGSPEAGSAAPYTDTENGAYYAEALGWAAEEGIAAGTAPDTFRPDDPVSREQLAVFLCRFAESQGCDVSGSADLSGFRDAGRVDAYAVSAVKWACACGILEGTAADLLSPDAAASRAQTAETVMRMCVNS